MYLQCFVSHNHCSRLPFKKSGGFISAADSFTCWQAFHSIVSPCSLLLVLHGNKIIRKVHGLVRAVAQCCLLCMSLPAVSAPFIVPCLFLSLMWMQSIDAVGKLAWELCASTSSETKDMEHWKGQTKYVSQEVSLVHAAPLSSPHVQASLSTTGHLKEL